MRTLSFLCLLGLTLIACYSCNKSLQTTRPPATIGLTTDPDLKTGSTGITLSQAEAIAQNFLQQKNPGLTITIKNSETMVSNGRPYFHVINANHGFVILSADSAYKPILAYDKTGNFSIAGGNLHPGLLNWFNKHAHELDYVRDAKNGFIDSVGRVNRALWQGIGPRAASPGPSTGAGSGAANSGPQNVVDMQPPTIVSRYDSDVNTIVTVGPLCPTFWGQDYPFNYYCPVGTYSGGHVPAGCVAVAMAQVMYFWKFPTTYANHTYDYAAMPLTLDAAYSLPIPGTYAQLISDVGTTIGTQYSNTGSGADPQNIPSAFALMGYTSATRTQGLTQQALSGADDGVTYAGLMTNEIQTNHRPCIAGGWPGYNGGVFGAGILPSPGGTGHSWVCDGSQQGTFEEIQVTIYSNHVRDIITVASGSLSMLHMNWGWESGTGDVDEDGNPLTDNGWYDCTVNYTQATSTQADNFQYFQIISYDIHP